MAKVKVIETVSETFSVDNSEAQQRQYAISAQVSKGSGKVSSVTRGVVTSLDDDHKRIALFNEYNVANLVVNFVSAQSDKQSVLDAIEAFIADVNAQFSTDNETQK